MYNTKLTVVKSAYFAMAGMGDKMDSLKSTTHVHSRMPLQRILRQVSHTE